MLAETTWAASVNTVLATGCVGLVTAVVYLFKQWRADIDARDAKILELTETVIKTLGESSHAMESLCSVTHSTEGAVHQEGKDTRQSITGRIDRLEADNFDRRGAGRLTQQISGED